MTIDVDVYYGVLLTALLATVAYWQAYRHCNWLSHACLRRGRDADSEHERAEQEKALRQRIEQASQHCYHKRRAAEAARDSMRREVNDLYRELNDTRAQVSAADAARSYAKSGASWEPHKHVDALDLFRESFFDKCVETAGLPVADRRRFLLSLTGSVHRAQEKLQEVCPHPMTVREAKDSLGGYMCNDCGRLFPDGGRDDG